jgi:hypothetical protein
LLPRCGPRWSLASFEAPLSLNQDDRDRDEGA